MTLYQRLNPYANVPAVHTLTEYLRERTFDAQMFELSTTAAMMSVILDIND
jgi:hypothetical protein